MLLTFTMLFFVVVLNYETLTVEMAQKRCYTKCFSRPIKVKDVRCAVC